jgi:hypothetical protein
VDEDFSLNAALKELEVHVEKLKAQDPHFRLDPTSIVGSEADLDDFVDFVSKDGRGRAEKVTLTCLSADSSSFPMVLMEHGKEALPWILIGYLAARKKVIEISTKDKIFRLENPDEKTLKRVLKVIETLTIKDKEK